MGNMKTLALTVEKLFATLKFQKVGQTPGQGHKCLVPTERSCHKEYSGKISKLCLSLFRSY